MAVLGFNACYVKRSSCQATVSAIKILSIFLSVARESVVKIPKSESDQMQQHENSHANCYTCKLHKIDFFIILISMYEKKEAVW